MSQLAAFLAKPIISKIPDFPDFAYSNIQICRMDALYRVKFDKYWPKCMARGDCLIPPSGKSGLTGTATRHSLFKPQHPFSGALMEESGDSRQSICHNGLKLEPLQFIQAIHRVFLASFYIPLCLSLQGCGFLSFSQNSDDLSVTAKKETVIKTACSQIGKKYRAGEASPHKGFDCSGLVWWSYRQHGISVPRITVDQAKAGRAVSRKQARPGDILVFKTSNSPHGLHTGLYYGKGKFVHSPSSGKTVTLQKLAGSWWDNKLVAIRRIGK